MEFKNNEEKMEYVSTYLLSGNEEVPEWVKPLLKELEK